MKKKNLECDKVENNTCQDFQGTAWRRKWIEILNILLSYCTLKEQCHKKNTHKFVDLDVNNTVHCAKPILYLRLKANGNSIFQLWQTRFQCGDSDYFWDIVDSERVWRFCDPPSKCYNCDCRTFEERPSFGLTSVALSQIPIGPRPGAVFFGSCDTLLKCLTNYLLYF